MFTIIVKNTTWELHIAIGISQNSVKTQIIGRCAMSLEFPSLVRSGVFLFFYFSQGGRAALFLLRSSPLF